MPFLVTPKRVVAANAVAGPGAAAVRAAATGAMVATGAAALRAGAATVVVALPAGAAAARIWHRGLRRLRLRRVRRLRLRPPRPAPEPAPEKRDCLVNETVWSRRCRPGLPENGLSTECAAIVARATLRPARYRPDAEFRGSISTSDASHRKCLTLRWCRVNVKMCFTGERWSDEGYESPDARGIKGFLFAPLGPNAWRSGAGSRRTCQCDVASCWPRSHTRFFRQRSDHEDPQCHHLPLPVLRQSRPQRTRRQAARVLRKADGQSGG